MITILKEKMKEVRTKYKEDKIYYEVETIRNFLNFYTDCTLEPYNFISDQGVWNYKKLEKEFLKKFNIELNK